MANSTTNSTNTTNSTKSTNTHKLFQSIRPRYARDLIVIANFLSDDRIFFADRKGRCETWVYESGKFVPKDELSISGEYCLHKAKSFTKFGREIILACTDTNNYLFVWASNKSRYGGWDRFQIEIQSDIPKNNQSKTIDLILQDNSIYLRIISDSGVSIYPIEFEISTNHNGLTAKQGTKLNDTSKIGIPLELSYSISDVVWKRNITVDVGSFDLGSVDNCSQSGVEKSSIISQSWVKKDDISSFSDKIWLEVKHDPTYVYYEHLARIYAICFSPKFIVVGHDGFLTIWK